MRLVFFTHPLFMQSQSMPRFASLLSNGMKQLGHQVDVWNPAPLFYKLPAPGFIKKWLGYIDQYVVFPIAAKIKIRRLPADTLFVFTDQALGPWVPLVKNKPHVIHCHDFLAQRSALGEIPENPTSRSGKVYQKYIYQGYNQGRNFISVSHKTREDLHRFLTGEKRISTVIYNGLNQDFVAHDVHASRKAMAKFTEKDLSAGYILHVGGNQWYKNRKEVIEIYDTWRKMYPNNTLPLLMVGAKPSVGLQAVHQGAEHKKDIVFLTGLSDLEVQLAYSGAHVFLFPSIAEGFGWPIAEAMVSGCPVITTNAAPMTEVSGDAGFLIPPYEQRTKEGSASILQQVVHLSVEQRTDAIQRGILQTKKFDAKSMIGNIEKVYKEILLNK